MTLGPASALMALPLASFPSACAEKVQSGVPGNGAFPASTVQVIFEAGPPHVFDPVPETVT